jgi:uncharacterized membrane protein
MNSTSPVLLCLIGLCFAYSCKNEIVTDKLDVHENHFEVQIFDSVMELIPTLIGWMFMSLLRIIN